MARFLCVSANPAIDKRLTVESLLAGKIHRARSTQSFPGGKATHVAMVLRTLGHAPEWVGPCGGATGVELVAGLSLLGIRAHACPAAQPTRTNLEIIDAHGRVTEILEPGCPLSPAELLAFETSCKRLFSENQKAAFVIFSGSLPAGVPSDLYARFIRSAKEFGCHTFVDTSGEALAHALAARPDFAKPNREEAAKLLGIAIDSRNVEVDALRRLIQLGARSAALSLGSEGLLFCPAKDAPPLFAPAAQLRVRSTVGCGDSALAGFAHSIASDASPEDALCLAAACAAANCLADSPGAARLEDIRRLQAVMVARGWETIADDR